MAVESAQLTTASYCFLKFGLNTPETPLKEDWVTSSCCKVTSKRRTNVDSFSIQKLSRYFCKGLNNRFNQHLSNIYYAVGISVFKKASS